MIPTLTLCSLDRLCGMIDVYNYIIRLVNILAFIYWLTCVLQKLPATTQWCKGHTRSTTLHGLAGYSSVKALDWEMILSLTTLPNAIASTSSSHLHTQYTAEDIVKQEWLRPFRAAQSKIPSQLYQRPSALTIGPTPQLTSMEKLFSFYNANGKHMQIQTDNENPKHPSTPPSRDT